MDDLDDSTIAEKALVCGTSFGFSCLAFFTSALVLIPATGTIAKALSLPSIVPQTLIVLQLIALPVGAAIWGVSVAAKPIMSRKTR